MSTIHMVEQVVDFKNNSSLNKGFFNKLTNSSSFLLPSNVISCSLMIKDFSFSNAKLTTSSAVVIPSGTDGINSLGWGVEDVSTLANRIFFTGWMQVSRFNGEDEGIPEPNDSYLTVLAIVQCE